MKCFIASAFGHSDVDQRYDKVVKHVLQDAGIEALRVDRVQHNEDIDDKIVQLMKEADFCIADLTYARPSVYYVAGYIQGADKPIIYTARTDHFRQRDQDEHGNLAIHFDLRMRNIIGWAENDDEFSKALGARLKYVTGPLRELLATQSTSATERTAFKRKAFTEQLRIIRDAALGLLRARGYSAEENYVARCTQAFGKTKITFDVIPGTAFLKQTRVDIRDDSIFAGHSEEASQGFQELKTVVVCVSPNPIPRAAFRRYFSTFEETDSAALHRTYNPGTGRWQAKAPHDVTICFIDRVESEADFRNRFKELLTKWT